MQAISEDETKWGQGLKQVPQHSIWRQTPGSSYELHIWCGIISTRNMGHDEGQKDIIYIITEE